MLIHFEGIISKKEYRQAVKNNYGPIITILQIIAGIIFFLLLANILIMMLGNDIPVSDLLRYSLPGLIFPLVLFLLPFIIPELQLSTYNNPNSPLRLPRSGEISEKGITTLGSNFSNTTQWNRYTHYRLSKDVLTLYSGKNCFDVFPRRLFSADEDWINFLELVKEKIK